MLVVIKVFGLPETVQQKLHELRDAIIKKVTAINELGLNDNSAVKVYFPVDAMYRSEKDDIYIEITGPLHLGSERTSEVCERVAESVAIEVHSAYSHANRVECLVTPFGSPCILWSSDDGSY